MRLLIGPYAVMGSAFVGRPLDQPGSTGSTPFKLCRILVSSLAKISSERDICSRPDLTDPLLQDRHIKKISNLTRETYMQVTSS